MQWLSIESQTPNLSSELTHKEGKTTPAYLPACGCWKGPRSTVKSLYKQSWPWHSLLRNQRESHTNLRWRGKHSRRVSTRVSFLWISQEAVMGRRLRALSWHASRASSATSTSSTRVSSRPHFWSWSWWSDSSQNSSLQLKNHFKCVWIILVLSPWSHSQARKLPSHKFPHIKSCTETSSPSSPQLTSKEIYVYGTYWKYDIPQDKYRSCYLCIHVQVHVLHVLTFSCAHLMMGSSQSITLVLTCTCLFLLQLCTSSCTLSDTPLLLLSTWHQFVKFWFTHNFPVCWMIYYKTWRPSNSRCLWSTLCQCSRLFVSRPWQINNLRIIGTTFLLRIMW